MNAARLFPLTFFRLSARKGRMSWGMKLQISLDRGLPESSERSEAGFQQHMGSNEQSFGPTEQSFGSTEQLICPTGRRLAAFRHGVGLICLTIAAAKLWLGRACLLSAAPQP